MSDCTLESRFARLRASWMVPRIRESSFLCSARISRWRERLFCFSAEEVRVASESRRRASWAVRVSRCEKGSVSSFCLLAFRGLFGEGEEAHPFEEVFYLGFLLLLILCGLRGDSRRRRELRVGVEKGFGRGIGQRFDFQVTVRKIPEILVIALAAGAAPSLSRTSRRVWKIESV